MSASKKFSSCCCKKAGSIGSGAGSGSGLSIGSGAGSGSGLLSSVHWELSSNNRVSTKLARSIRVENTISAVVLEIDSDKRLKTNIASVTATDKSSTETLFNSIEAKKFSYKTHPDDTHYGFIAQDIKNAGNGLEHLVSMNENGFYSVRMLEIIPFLFAKIKQLEERIAQLEK